MKNILSPFVASLPLSIAITISAPLNALAQDYGLHSEHSTTIAPTQASDKEGKTRADWRWEEDKLIATLGTKPKESLAALNAEINKRRREDPKNPSLSFSLNVIGYQLTELGRYADAEPFLKEAIALRKALRSTKPAELVHIRIVFGRQIASIWPAKRMVFGHPVAFNLAGQSH